MSPAPERLLEWVSRGRRLPAAALVALCLALLGPGVFSMPPVDRDESRFAQASSQMLAAQTPGGWIVPRVQDRPRLNKPPLIYWLQAGSAWLLGEPEAGTGLPTGGIGAYRLVSVASAIIAALATWSIALGMFGTRVGGREAAWLAGAMMASCVMVMWDARQARADQLLLACTTGAMGCLWVIWKKSAEGGERPGVLWPVAFWVCVGLGVMTKGPITPMIALLATTALCPLGAGWRWLRATRPILGVVIVVVIVGPWVALVAREVGFGEYARTVFEETLGRSASAAEGHWGPPGYHLVLLPVLFWPGSLLTGAALVRLFSRRADASAERGVRAWFGRREDWERFCFAWIVPSWIVFELVTTKLPHYTLPLYPAIAILTAGTIRRSMEGVDVRHGKAGTVIWLLIGLGIAVGVPVTLASQLGIEAGAPARAAMWIAIAGAAAMLGLSARLAFRCRFAGSLVLGLGASVALSAGLFGIALPRAEPMWVSSQIVREIRKLDSAGVRPVASVSYHEDSLIFLTDGRLRRLGMKKARAWLAENPTGLMVLPREQLPAMGQARVVGEVSGLNYSKGERVDLVIVENEGPGG